MRLRNQALDLAESSDARRAAALGSGWTSDQEALDLARHWQDEDETVEVVVEEEVEE